MVAANEIFIVSKYKFDEVIIELTILLKSDLWQIGCRVERKAHS
jgi:hypothetical protein